MLLPYSPQIDRQLPEIIVIRHGQTAWNVDGRWQGRLDSPLTDQGIAQAQAVGAMCARLGLNRYSHDIKCSPQPRAARTAKIAFGPGIDADDRLAEIDVGDWTGALTADLRAQSGAAPDANMLDLYEMAPQGEGLAGVLARVTPFLSELTRPTILVTHGITGRAIRTLALGLPSPEVGRLPGGQGIAYRITDGVETCLTPDAADLVATDASPG